MQLEAEHQILLCRLCATAVRPGTGIETHFRQQHLLKGQPLQDILRYFGDMELVDPTTAALPADRSAPIQSLPVLEGLSCTACRFLTTASDNLTRHWRTAGHQAPGERSTRVKLQRWLAGNRARYWIVSDSNDEEVAAEGGVDKLIHDWEVEVANEDGARLRRGDAQEGLDHDSSWVKRTGWARHFGARDLLDVFAAAQWVRARGAGGPRQHQQEDEAAGRKRAQLVRLGKSFDRELERCSYRLDCVPTETLQWLASVVPTAPHGVPFGRLGKEASISKYRSVGHRYLGFALEAYRLGREEAFARLAASFTDEQWSLLGDVVEEVEADKVSGGYDRRHISEADVGREEEEEEEEDEGGADDGADGQLDRAVFLFLVHSIKQQVSGNAYASPLLCFCAALGITEQPLGYTEPHLYTGMLAAVLWWSRVMLLESVFEGQAVEVEEVGMELLEAFRQEHAKWMCVGTYTVISTIVGWMAYGKGHRNKTGGQPSVRWAEDSRVLFHNGERVAVDDFRRTLRGAVSETEGLLDQLTGSWARLSREVDMGRIADSMMRLGAGQSFATKAKNQWLEPGSGKVLRLVETSLWDAAQNRLKAAGVRRWLRRLRLFREGLLLLVHCWGGQPGRGPELMTMRHCDSWQLMRNVFVEKGQVMLVTDRDKMKSIRDNGRKVARFLPDGIGRMVVAYVAWLMPLERMLRRKSQMPEPREEQLEFMWRDGSSKVWDTGRLSRVLARVMEAGTGVRIGAGRYRPIAIEFGRRVKGLATKQAQTQLGDDNDDPDDNVDVDPVTGEPVDCGGSWDVVWDLQSTHGSRIALQHYAVHIGYPGRLDPQKMDLFREVSRLWHQFLEHDEAAGGKRKREGPPAAPGGDVALGLAKRSRPTVAVAKDPERELQDGLRRLLGAGSRWRSDKQAESMRTIMGLADGQSAISVLPTGAGKSILFMLPAMLRDSGTSIVVVPFVALVEDLVERARDMGVDCIRFRSSLSAGREGMARAARLVVVSADTVSGSEFAGYADALVATGLLQRIFVDECHTVITDSGFRQRLGELRSLHRYGQPLVLLTATLPVVLGDWFRQEMLVGSAVMVRDRTTKKNCRYRIEQAAARQGAVLQQTVAVVQRLSEGMVDQQKGVVYCRSRGKCEALAGELGCDFHHSSMTDGERREVREAWARGRGHRWVVATSGLGTGVDIGGIVAVVHMEQPYGLVDFVQQTGRGGRREGEVVESVIVHDGRPAWADPNEGFVEAVNRAQMEAFMTTPGCRRSVIAAFMDGVDGERCGDVPGAEKCDRCLAEGRLEAKGLGGGIWRAFGAEEGLRVRTLLRWLDEVADECPVCHVRRHFAGLGLEAVAERPRHKKAGRWCMGVAGESYQDARRQVRFGELSCCFRCKLPLDWCEQTRAEGEEACAYIDKVLPVVLSALTWQRVGDIAKEQFGVDVADRTGFYRWLGGRRRFHGTSGSNALALWEAIIWEAYKGGRYWFTG